MRDISIHVCLSCTHSFHNIFCTHITPARWTTFSPTSSWCGLGPSVRTVLMLTGESLCPSLFNMMSAQTIQNQFRIRDISSSFCACFAHPNQLDRSRSPKMHCIHLLVCISLVVLLMTMTMPTTTTTVGTVRKIAFLGN